ncbi:MAG: 4Fe-4S binding protein [bacterium]
MKIMSEPHTIYDTTCRNNLCIGCGICALACPEDAISMRWTEKLVYEPEVDKEKCTYCGICIKACPHTPSKLAFYARQTFRQGEKFGLGDDFSYYISYDNDLEARLKSSSGGALTAVLKHLLDSGEVKTVVASKPLMAPFGRPHYQIENCHTSSELEKSRSSHYHPLNYYPALKKATEAC